MEQLYKTVLQSFSHSFSPLSGAHLESSWSGQQQGKTTAPGFLQQWGSCCKVRGVCGMFFAGKRPWWAQSVQVLFVLSCVACWLEIHYSIKCLCSCLVQGCCIRSVHIHIPKFRSAELLMSKCDAGKLWICIHITIQDTKQHSCLVHGGIVYMSAFFLKFWYNSGTMIVQLSPLVRQKRTFQLQVRTGVSRPYPCRCSATVR